MRRVVESPPEVRALVADRLQFVLGRTGAGPPGGRAAGAPEAPEAEAAPAEDRLDVGPELGRPMLPGFARAHLAVVTVLVLVGLLGAGWALFRARPVVVAGPGAVVSTVAAPGGGGGGVTSATASPPVELVVHVVGAVRRPGLVRLPDGARVQDAVDAAGGLTRDARPGRLNLAEVLRDGQQVVLGSVRDPVSEVREGSAPAEGSAGPRPSASTLDLNRATATELEQLPGVGPVTAGAIVAWRTQHGRFGAVAELQQVDGIGPKTYAQIAPHVRV